MNRQAPPNQIGAYTLSSVEQYKENSKNIKGSGNP